MARRAKLTAPPVSTVPTLSIRQPHAAWIFHPDPNHRKRIENRSWPTEHRGRLLIHVSGKLTPRDVDELARITAFFKLPVELLRLSGAIIGEVELVECIPNPNRRDGDPTEADAKRLGVSLPCAFQFAEMSSRYHWRIENPRLFKDPIPTAGALRLWTFQLPNDIEYTSIPIQKRRRRRQAS